MPVIQSPQELQKVMEDILEKVILSVSFKITLMLQRSIRSNVYQSHPANKYYYNGSKRPTMELLSAWNWKGIQKGIGSLVREMTYDWEKMSNDPDTWLHGSNVSGWPKDAREALPSFLDKDGFSSSLWISVQHRPFWSLFVDELESKIKNMLDGEFAKFGIRRG